LIRFLGLTWDLVENKLRGDLAIRKEWGVKIDKVSEFNIPKGTWISEGKVAA
jgi:hypothetical protein